jgi:hypothetical protein
MTTTHDPHRHPMEMTPGWEIVHDEPFARVRRFGVPGGWLYQVETDQTLETDQTYEPLRDGEVRWGGAHRTGWDPAVFVPAPGGGS